VRELRAAADEAEKVAAAATEHARVLRERARTAEQELGVVV
jgi:hypothetical protein